MHEQETFELRSHAGVLPVLQRVEAAGRCDGVVFEMTLRQHYRNDSDDVLEVVYTFPMPHGSTLLGFAAELDDRRLVATAMPRAAAETRYEEALAEGDAPVLLSESSPGLHTATIGNLKPGGTITLEVRWASLVALEQGRLRLAVPTTIAPRYGAPAAAGLAPEQVPQASIGAAYPLSLAIDFDGALARARLECPTHPCDVVAQGAGRGQRLTLAPGGMLDRDIVVLATPAEPWPSVLAVGTDRTDAQAPTVLAATFVPPVPAGAVPARAVRLELLVDCSGSMAGSSIGSARRALRGLLGDLQPEDEVGCRRFGSEVHTLRERAACTPGHLRALQAAIDSLEADLGGTEIPAALEALARGPARSSGMPPPQRDVLLITDGEVWDSAATVQAARAANLRVFVIGVGASPAEAVLRELAAGTGGACEMVTPGEALEEAAPRMLARMRRPSWQALSVDWGVPVVWQSALPDRAYAGDPVRVWAAVAGSPPSPAAVVLKGRADGEAAPLRLRTEVPVTTPGDTLARLAAATRLPGLDAASARELAVRHNLAGRHTHLVLVHERADGERAVDLPVQHQVASMLAAGWGGFGQVPERAMLCAAPMPFGGPRMMATTGDSSELAPAQPRPALRPEDFEQACEDTSYRDKLMARDPRPYDPLLIELVVVLDRLLATGVQPAAMADALDREGGLPSLWHDAIAAAIDRGASRDEAWLVLACMAVEAAGVPDDHPVIVAARALVLVRRYTYWREIAYSLAAYDGVPRATA